MRSRFFTIGFFAFFFFATKAVAQPFIFNNTYDHPTASFGVESIGQNPDGSYRVGGSVADTSLDMLLVKLDPSGSMLWANTYSVVTSAPLFSRVFSAVASPDGGYLLAGHTLNPGHYMLVKTDAAGAITWSGVYRVPGHFISYVPSGFATYAGNGAYVIGTDVNDSVTGMDWVHLFKIDSLGNVLWSYRYKHFGGTKTGTYNVEQCPDGGFALAGSAFDTTGYAFIIRVDSVGNLLWTNYYYSADYLWGYGFCRTADHGFAIVGRIGPGHDPFILKTDSAGNVQWSRKMATASSAFQGEYIVQRADGGYFLGLRYMSTPVVYLVSLDSAGSFQRGKNFGSTVPKGICLSGPNTAMLLTAGSNYTRFSLISTDSTGHANCALNANFSLANISVSILLDTIHDTVSMLPVAHTMSVAGMLVNKSPCNMIGVESLPGESAPLIYPNPASDAVHVENYGSNSLACIYNLQGQCVSTTNLLGSNAEIDIRALAEGMYILALFSEEGQLAGRQRIVVTHR